MKNHTPQKDTLLRTGVFAPVRRVTACLLAVALIAASMPVFQAFGEENTAPVVQTVLQTTTPETAATPLPPEESLPAGTPLPAEEPLPTETPLPVEEPPTAEEVPAEPATPENALPAPLDVPSTATVPADAGVPLDSAHFPDAAFLGSIRKLDTDGDGVLSPAECDAVTSLDVRSKGIASLEGIGCFTRLTYLNCIGNELTSLPLEQLPGLTRLLCNENQLTTLDLAQVPGLQLLHCHDNRLTALDVSPLTQLQELACGHNLFTSLDLSGNKSLAYFLYLGGPLQTLTLSGNDGLLHLWCSYSLVSQLDLAQAPNLEQLGIERSDFSYLDLSANAKLTDVLAGNNLLLAVRMGDASPAITLAGQRPVTVQLAEGQTTYDLNDLGVPLALDCISDVTGAQLTGSVLSGLQDGSVVTYRYTDGTADFTATLQFSVSNGWEEPLTLEDWTYGQPANTPHAQAEYGQPLYSYSATADGIFTEQVPDQAGTWYVKAVVPPTEGHAGLEAITEFHILKAQPDYTIPTGLTAVYGSTLAAVDPGTGFAWQTPDQKVGDVGTRTFAADYHPADQQNYTSVEGLAIPLQITPKPASQLWVSPVTNEQEAAGLTVKDGTEVLQQDKDYTVTRQEKNGRVVLTLTFRGNYEGTILRDYSAAQTLPAASPQPAAPAPPAATARPVQPPQSPAPETVAAAESQAVENTIRQTEPQPTAAPQTTPAPTATPSVTGEELPAPTPGPATPEPAQPEEGEAESEVPARTHTVWLWWLLLLLLVVLLAVLYLLRTRREEPTDQEDTHTGS